MELVIKKSSTYITLIKTAHATDTNTTPQFLFCVNCENPRGLHGRRLTAYDDYVSSQECRFQNCLDVNFSVFNFTVPGPNAFGSALKKSMRHLRRQYSFIHSVIDMVGKLSTVRSTRFIFLQTGFVKAWNRKDNLKQLGVDLGASMFSPSLAYTFLYTVVWVVSVGADRRLLRLR